MMNGKNKVKKRAIARSCGVWWWKIISKGLSLERIVQHNQPIFA